MVAVTSIYLDYNATTPCDPQVIEAMLPYFGEIYGNPANGYHILGRVAHQAVEEAREQVAELVNARAEEIVFTAGATESNNLAILGLARASKGTGRGRIVTAAVEHKAVLAPCEELAKEGFEIVVLPAEADGWVSLAAAQEAINDRTLLVSVQAANNEIGTIQPVAEIAQLAHKHGAIMHTDAAQAVGKIPIDVQALGVDMLSMSAHKFYGPKGIGALFMRSGVRYLTPLAFGGGQERGLRPGTSNVPAVVGFGAASRLCQRLLPMEGQRIVELRDRLESRLISGIPGLTINGRHGLRLPNTSSLTFPGIEADALIFNLPELMLGTGSACTSGAVEPSHVLQAIGLDRAAASATVRASLGRFTTEPEVDNASELIIRAWQSLAVAISNH
jgi:cysteine desulfurase